MNAVIFEKPDVVILSHQRSGTHFLEASLASHPHIHKRGECILRYKRFGLEGEDAVRFVRDHIYTNKPGCLNVMIVMYDEVHTFEKLFGSLFYMKIIHLLRNPEDVAKSSLQKYANEAYYGVNYKTRYKVHEQRPRNAPFDLGKIPELMSMIAHEHAKHLKILRKHRDVFYVNYDELTRNTQVNALPREFCTSILAFLNLDYHPLTNDLQKVIRAENSLTG